MAGTLAIVGASSSRAARNPLPYVRLTRAQAQFCALSDPEGLWRDGNQLGKSFALAYDIVQTARRTHPYRPNKSRPVNIMVASISYEQMMPLMEKIWTLVPKDEIDPRNGFDPGRGITGKPPRIVFTDGPGRGSVINFATYEAGARRVAGFTGDYLAMDEPPEESFYGEALPRVMRRQGIVRVTMTPTPDMPDQAWFKERVDLGQVQEVNFGLAEEYLLPEGYPMPWLTQSEIDRYAQSLLEHQRGMRIRGDWFALSVGRWLHSFDTANVVEFDVRSLKGWYLVVGMDHGTPGGKQAAVLIAVKDRHSDRPQVRFIDESINEGFTSPEDDAQAVLDMLRRNGLTYDNVDDWVGDVPTQSKLWDVRKSNAEIRKEMAKILGRRVEKTKFIAEPKKWSGSMSDGMRKLNTLFGRRTRLNVPDAIVHPKCAQFVNACWNFKGHPKDPVKDGLDGGRYPVERAVTGRILPALQASY